MPQPSLKILENGEHRFDVSLEEGRRYSVGRSHENDVVLAAPSVSRRHAELFRDGERWRIRDVGSSNGTFVDGVRTSEPVAISSGSSVRVGPFELKLDDGSAPEAPAVSFSEDEAAPGTFMLSLDDALHSSSALVGESEAARAEIEALRRHFDIVARANLELLGHVPIDQLLQKILDLVFEAVHPHRAAILRRSDDGTLVCRAVRGTTGGSEFKVSRTVANAVTEHRNAVLTADAQLDGRFAGQESVIAQGIRSVMAVPLWDGERVIGLIYADSSVGAQHFREVDLRVLTMLANIAAIQIRNAVLFEEQIEKRRLEQEARAAADVQARLLPAEPPSLPGYRVFGSNVPCNEVGGDYFDFTPLTGQHHGIMLADVAGKGMPAALLMAVVQSTFRSIAHRNVGPEDLLGTISQAVSRSSPSNRFVTAFFIDLDVSTHVARYVNAGHAPEPVIIRCSGEIESLAAGGMPLGIFPDFTYSAGEFTLEPGDLLVACTDGISEARDEAGDLFGEERLVELLKAQAGRSADEVAATLQRELETYCAGEPQADDETIVILGREA